MSAKVTGSAVDLPSQKRACSCAGSGWTIGSTRAQMSLLRILKGHTVDIQAMAYLGFPAPVGNVSLGAPTQSVRGNTEAKNELGVKGCRKLSRTSRIVVSRLV